MKNSASLKRTISFISAPQYSAVNWLNTAFCQHGHAHADQRIGKISLVFDRSYQR
jgi:hypothetical protein